MTLLIKGIRLVILTQDAAPTLNISDLFAFDNDLNPIAPSSPHASSENVNFDAGFMIDGLDLDQWQPAPGYALPQTAGMFFATPQLVQRLSVRARTTATLAGPISGNLEYTLDGVAWLAFTENASFTFNPWGAIRETQTLTGFNDPTPPEPIRTPAFFPYYALGLGKKAKKARRKKRL